jgi:hypothetical protein
MIRDTRVILQPAGGSQATAHYLKTVRNEVPLATIAHLLSEANAQQLGSKFPSGRCRAWGVTPGLNGINRAKWDQFSPGDRVLFCGESRVYASGSLRCKLHSRELAFFLWGEDADRQTWEYMYFLGAVRDQNIPVRELGTVVGYQPGYNVLGVNILDSRKSAAALNAFDLSDD